MIDNGFFYAVTFVAGFIFAGNAIADVSSLTKVVTSRVIVNSESVNLKLVKDDFSSIFDSGLDGSFGEPGNPFLPAKQLFFAIPEGCEIGNIEVNVTWQRFASDILLVPRQEATEVGKEQIWTEPNPTIYSSSEFYPAKEFFTSDVISASGVKILPILAVPFRYTPTKKELEIAKSLEVKVTFKTANRLSIQSNSATKYSSKLRNGIAQLVENHNDVEVSPSSSKLSIMSDNVQPDYIVISPSALTNAWTEYVATRQKKFPDLVFSVKNADEIYDDYENFTYPGTTLKPRNEIEKIHQFIKEQAVAGTTYFLLGGPVLQNENGGNRTTAFGALSLTNAIPTCITKVEDVNTKIPSDMFFGCVDDNGATVSFPYPWDSDGDGVYVYGETTAKIDVVPDVVISRFTALPHAYYKGGKTYTSEELIKIYSERLARGEDENFSGQFRTFHGGAIMTSSESKSNASASHVVRTELDFYDDIHNMYSSKHGDKITDSEYSLRVRHERYVAKHRPFLGGGAGFEGYGVYTKDMMTLGLATSQFRNENWEYCDLAAHGTVDTSPPFSLAHFASWSGLLKVFAQQIPCSTGRFVRTEGSTQVAPCIGEMAVNHPNGGSLVSYNNTDLGWAGNTWDDNGVSAGLQKLAMEGLFVHDYNAGNAWRDAAVKFAPQLGNLQNKTGRCHVNVILLGDPLVQITPIQNYSWNGNSGSWNISSADWIDDSGKAVNYRHAKNTAFKLNASTTINATDKMSSLTISVDQPSDATFTITGDNYLKIMNGITVTNGNLNIGFAGGVGRNGIEFANRGNLTISSLKQTYIAAVSNANDVVITGANSIFDFGKRTVYNANSLIYDGRGIGVSTGNVIRGFNTALTDKTVVIKNSEVTLETMDIGGNASKDRPLFAITNGILTIAKNPMSGGETLSRPIILNNGILRSNVTGATLGNADNSGVIFTISGISEIQTVTDSTPFKLNGTVNLELEENSSLLLSAKFTNGSNGEIKLSGKGKAVVTETTSGIPAIAVMENSELVFGNNRLTATTLKAESNGAMSFILETAEETADVVDLIPAETKLNPESLKISLIKSDGSLRTAKSFYVVDGVLKAFFNDYVPPRHGLRVNLK